MGKSKLLSLSLIASIFLFAVVIWADIPPPPANQQIGITDTTYNNLTEDECRLCHENPEQFPSVKDETITNRHHLLFGQSIAEGCVERDPHEPYPA